MAADTLTVTLLFIAAFLMGSIPFGMVFAGARGVDLRRTGSGNIGATNVLRSAGKGAALMTLLADILKGTAAVAAGKIFGLGPLYEGLMGLSAIAGHDFSVFLRFRGGKGVATSVGVMLIYAPPAGILTIILWLAAVGVSRYSSLGALVSFALLPATMVVTGYAGEKLVLSVIISLLLIARHAGNIKRLLNKTERRVGEKT